tara:strand:+ start:131953 stop:132114 length:162 start_codon:yes stop_codon:yes gene_type:complete
MVFKEFYQFLADFHLFGSAIWAFYLFIKANDPISEFIEKGRLAFCLRLIFSFW